MNALKSMHFHFISLKTARKTDLPTTVGRPKAKAKAKARYTLRVFTAREHGTVYWP